MPACALATRRRRASSMTRETIVCRFDRRAVRLSALIAAKVWRTFRRRASRRLSAVERAFCPAVVLDRVLLLVVERASRPAAVLGFAPVVLV